MNLANLMSVPVADVISKCIELGLMVSINQRLDVDTITLVADEFGFEVEIQKKNIHLKFLKIFLMIRKH